MLKHYFSTAMLLSLVAQLVAQTIPEPCKIQAPVGIEFCIDAPGCIVFGVDIENGTGPYTYHWSNGSTNQSIAYSPSNYQNTCEIVTVTDSKGCKAISGAVSLWPYQMQANFVISPDIINAEGNPTDFDVSLNDIHGAGAFLLVQAPIHGSVVFNDNGTGIYTPNTSWCGPDYFRYLFHDDSCRYSEIVDVTVLNGPCAQILTGKIDCNGACSGEALFYTNGMFTPPLTYLWSNGETTARATQLCGGPISVTVTDALGASDAYQSSIETGMLSVTIPSLARSCENEQVLLTPQIDSSGVGNLYFNWSGSSFWPPTNQNQLVYPGQSNSPILFKLAVFSDMGCVDSTSFQVGEILDAPYLYNGAIDLEEAITCPQDTLHLSVKVQAGTPPYQYQWTGPLGIQASTPELYWPNITSAQSGGYRVKVSDVNGCYDYASAQINIPSTFNITLIAYGSNTPICQGSSFKLSYGMSNYWIEEHTVEWTGPNGFYSTERNPVLQDITPAMAGDYSLKVIFGEGCFATSSTTVAVASSSAYITDLQITPPTDCVIPHNGKVTVTMSVPPPYYASIGGASQNYTTNPFTINNLNASDYHTLAITKNNCSLIQDIDIPAPTAPTVLATDETCNQGGTGSVQSINPMQYVNWWDLGSGSWSGEQVTGLHAGTYIVDMKDAVTNCQFRDTVIVNPYLNFEAAVVDSPSCDIPNGALTAVELGQATPPVTYQWSNGFSGAENMSLAHGWYSVTMSDGAGCMRHQNIFLPPDEPCFGLISGRVLVNSNCSCDVNGNEIPYANLRVCAENGSYKDCAYTDNTGAYQLATGGQGQYTISVHHTNNNLNITCPTTTVDIPTLTSSASDVNMFLCGSLFSDYALGMNCGVARPGFNQQYRFSVYNFGIYDKDTAIVTVNLSDELLIQQITPTPISYDPATNQVSWKVTRIPINSIEYFQINAKVLAPLGSVLEATAEVSLLRPDVDITNNSTYCETMVVGSFDPNDKNVNLINANVDDSQLTYTIRFQNTGTDTAFTVIVRDTLNGDVFDLESVRPVMASHPYKLDVEGENILVFIFENILLPDSNRTVEGSKGYAIFNINLKPNLPIGTVIGNQAAIYFDYNAPVITNEAITEIVNPDCPYPPIPNIAQAAHIEICLGETVMLEATACDGCSLMWSNGEVTPSINVSTAGSFTVSAINACGISLPSANVEVSIKAPPTTPIVLAQGVTHLCEGQQLTLIASNICDGCEVLWSNGETTPSITVSTSGAYTASAKNQCGESLPAPIVEVTMLTAPSAPLISAQGIPQLCEGQQLTLIASNICDGCEVHWSNGETTPSITVSTSGAYTVLAINACGESSPSDPIEIESMPSPITPIVMLNGPNAICEGQMTALFVSNYENCAVCQIEWSNGLNSESIQINTPGSYTVTYNNICGTSENSLPVEIDYLQFTPEITTADSCTLIASPGSAYQWLLNDSLLHSEISQELSISQDGVYTVYVVNTDGCSGFSPPFIVTDCSASFSFEENNAAQITVSPNPAKERLYFELNLDKAAKLRLDVLHINGYMYKTVFDGTKNKGKHLFELDLDDAPSGIYYYQLSGLNYMVRHKIIIIK